MALATVSAVNRQIMMVFFAQKFVVVSCRIALGAVFLLERVVTQSAVDPSQHFWVVLPQETRIGPAGVLTPASRG
jgi:hypothetical protein